jgi:hypothetical protein
VISGRHAQVLIVGGDPRDQSTFIGVTGDDDRPVHPLSESALARVEPQLRLAAAGIGAVALEAARGEDRLDVAAEIDGGGEAWQVQRQAERGRDEDQWRRAHRHSKIFLAASERRPAAKRSSCEARLL